MSFMQHFSLKNMSNDSIHALDLPIYRVFLELFYWSKIVHKSLNEYIWKSFIFWQLILPKRHLSISNKNLSNKRIQVLNEANDFTSFLFFHNYFIGQKLCIKALLNRKKLHYFPAAAFSAAAAAFFSCFSLIIWASRSFLCSTVNPA